MARSDTRMVAVWRCVYLSASQTRLQTTPPLPKQVLPEKRSQALCLAVSVAESPGEEGDPGCVSFFLLKFKGGVLSGDYVLPQLRKAYCGR